MRACPYAVGDTVPSSPTGATDGLSDAHDTPVAGPMTAPDSPATVSVVRPGATAVTTPVRLTRATLASAVDHCSASALTRRPPCTGTVTCSVSMSPGDITRGTGSWTATSLGCTTTGAVVVSPPAPGWGERAPRAGSSCWQPGQEDRPQPGPPRCPCAPRPALR